MWTSAHLIEATGSPEAISADFPEVLAALVERAQR
jgi:hypothetical protein